MELVFRSIARQVEMPDEILIADDGSRDDTAALIASWASELPVPVKHIWQEDDGFRLARSRKRAIAASVEYLIIIDGDMVLHRQFVADHKRVARPGYFVQGERVLTTPGTRKILANAILDLRFFSSVVSVVAAPFATSC